jgi:hypothetical protein
MGAAVSATLRDDRVPPLWMLADAGTIHHDLLVPRRCPSAPDHRAVRARTSTLKSRAGPTEGAMRDRAAKTARRPVARH